MIDSSDFPVTDYGFELPPTFEQHQHMLAGYEANKGAWLMHLNSYRRQKVVGKYNSVVMYCAQSGCSYELMVWMNNQEE